MQVAILGELTVSTDGRPVEVSGTRLRLLLLRLALDAGQPVSPSLLVEAIWDGSPPADPVNALQTLVSRLRRALGSPEYVQQLPSGYRLTGVELDTDRCTELAAAGRRAAAAGDPAAAATSFGQALRLWRGTPLAEVADADWASIASDYWTELLLELTADRIEAELDAATSGLASGSPLGSSATGTADPATDHLGELNLLVSRYPLRERFTGLQMRALSAAGRTAEALACYERLRSQLADELGADPDPALQQQHLRLLRATTEQPSADNAPPHRQRRSNLRSALTSFIGREDEIGRVFGLLESGRLATVLGPGGAGKTRLAGVVAAGWTDRSPDGVWFVELAPVTEESELPQAILDSLGIRVNQLLERGGDLSRLSALDRLRDVLADSSCLLVIDNCEHLIASVARLLDLLLAHCPNLRVLATSREPLGIDGEALCLLAPLDLPDQGASAEQASSAAAVRLFGERAAAVSAGFAVDDSTVEAVIEIVRRLDGLPLAIELAAARLRVLPVTEIASRLTDRFRLLTGGSRAGLARHRTLRAVVDWSWELLTDAERVLAERLAVFPSGATPDSASAVCADARLATRQIPELLDALVEKSLLQLDGTGELRYRMLETIREYGLQRLTERHELAELRDAHARYFDALVARAVPRLRTADQLRWLHLLAAERDNCLAALRHLGESGQKRRALRMAASLGWYWTMLGSHDEVLQWLGFALQSKGIANPGDELMVEALLATNELATSFGDSPGADVSASLDRLTELGRRLEQAPAERNPMILLMRAIVGFFGGDQQRVLDLLEPAVHCPDRWIAAAALMFRSNVHDNSGNVAAMRADALAALSIFTELGDRWGLSSTLTALARVHMLDGELDTAAEQYQQAITQLSELGAAADESMLYLRLADLHLRRHDLPAAKAAAGRAHNSEFRAGSRAQRLLADTALAAIAIAEPDPAAIEFYRKSMAEQLEQLQPVHPINGHVRAITLATLAELEAEPDGGAGRLVQAYREGLGTRDMPIMATIAVAVASCAGRRGADRDAAEILGAAAAIRGADDATDVMVSRLTATLQANLGEQEVAKHYAIGRRLSREDALNRADPKLLAPIDS